VICYNSVFVEEKLVQQQFGFNFATVSWQRSFSYEMSWFYDIVKYFVF